MEEILESTISTNKIDNSNNNSSCSGKTNIKDNNKFDISSVSIQLNSYDNICFDKDNCNDSSIENEHIKELKYKYNQLKNYIKRLQKRIKPLQQKHQMSIDKLKSLGQEIQSLQTNGDKYIQKGKVVIVKEKLKRYFGIYATRGLVVITDDSTICNVSNKENTRFIKIRLYHAVGTSYYKEIEDQIKKQISFYIINRIKGLYPHLKSLEREGLIKSYKDYIMIGFGSSGINSNSRFFNILKNQGYNLRIVDDRSLDDVCSTCTVFNDEKLLSLYPDFEDIQYIQDAVGLVVCKNHYTNTCVNISICINFKSKCMDQFPHHNQYSIIQHFN